MCCVWLCALFLLTVNIPVLTVHTHDIHDGCPFVPSSTPRGIILIHVCMHVRIYVHARISTPIQPCIYLFQMQCSKYSRLNLYPPQPPLHLHSFFFHFSFLFLSSFSWVLPVASLRLKPTRGLLGGRHGTTLTDIARRTKDTTHLKQERERGD